MIRLHLMILLLLLGTAAAHAQETEADTDDENAVEQEAVPEGEASDEEIEELLGLEEDYTEVDDDDFDPTDEVRLEQSIPFPTDI